jgi:cytidine deaminase
MTLEQIAELMNVGQLAAAEVQRIGAQEGKTADELAVELLPLAQKLARPVISGYQVGAAVQGTSGALYLGGNLEFPGNSLGMTVHAEQAAVANAFMSGDTGITAIAVTSRPCGHCRQFLYEFAGGHDIRILGNSPAWLSTLLPDFFGPKDLGRSEGPFAHTSNLLSLSSGDELTKAALDAANRSYAPYSRSPAGVALRSRTGRVYQGAYLENAAFNPSLSPLQTALVRMAAAGEAFDEIANVALVELRDAAISQSTATRAVLEAIAPQTNLDVIHARP